MTSGSPELSRVIIFEENDPIWLDLAEEGAAEAGWQAVPFMNPWEAFEALDSKAQALVTALGFANPLGGRHPARHLIQRSDELNIPRALLSGHPNAAEFIRKGTTDVVIPKEATLEIPRLVSAWLISLSQQ